MSNKLLEFLMLMSIERDLLDLITVNDVRQWLAKELAIY